MSLPFIPDVIKNEHPKFYLVKLAEANGYSFMADLLHANHQKLPIHQAQQLSAFKKIVYELTGRSYELDYVDKNMYEHRRYFQSLLSPHAKICPICCIEGHSPIEHSFLFSSRCNIHNIQLLDACSSCGHALEWDNLLTVGKCNYCGSVLPQKVIVESPVQTYVNHHGLKASLPFINDLCLMTSHLIRPLDNQPEKIAKKRIVKSGELFDLAYQMLSSTELCRAWLQHLYRNRSQQLTHLGHSAVEALFAHVKSQLNLDNWLIAFKSVSPANKATMHVIFDEYEVEEFSIQTQWKTRNKDIEQQCTVAQYKCNAQLLAKILGCSVNTVFSLSEYGLFSSLNTKGFSESTYFNLKEVDQTLPNSVNDKGYLGMRMMDYCDILRILPHFNIKESCFITTVIREQIPVSFKDNPSPFFGKLQITPFTFYRTIRKILLDNSNEKIKHDVAKNIYCISELDIRALLHHNKISIQKWRQVSTYYSTTDFEKMERSHFNLARYCFFRGLNFNAIYNRLKQKGILPSIGKSYFDNRRYIVHFIKTGKVKLLNQESVKNLHSSATSINSFLNSMPILSNKKR